MSNGDLHVGSSGDGVRLLQRGLAAAGFDPGPADGIFGTMTERAVKAFQASRDLAIDGVAGDPTRRALRRLRIPLIAIRQPRPWDVVGDPVVVAGLAGAFEATFQARVRDANGNVLVDQTKTRGRGDGVSEIHFEISTGVPPTPNGAVDVFEFSAEDGSVINRNLIPVVFGVAIMQPDGYGAFQPYTVQAGDTLSALARRYYGNAALANRIFQANPHQLSDPDEIVSGQILRIPIS